MRENAIKVLNSIKNVSKVENDDQSFIVIANNIDGEDIEYTINFDNNFGISVRNNFTGVFSNDFNSEPFILNTIYKTLKEMIGKNKISFTEKFGNKIIDDIKKIQLMDKNIYLLLLKLSCKLGNPAALKNLMLEYKDYFYSLTSDEKQEIVELACYSGSTELVHILLNNEKIDPKNGDFIGVKNNNNKIIPEKNFKFGFSALKGAFEGGNFEIFDFLLKIKL